MDSFMTQQVRYYGTLGMATVRRMLPMVEANKDGLGIRLLRMLMDMTDAQNDPTEEEYVASMRTLILVCEAWMVENEMDV